MKRLSLALIALAVTVSAAFAHAGHAVKMVGGVLVNASGMTLYTFDMDVAGAGKSKCNGPCAALWPPAMAAADARPEGELSLVARDDGTRQWAYKGKPVYTYAADKKAGDMTGDNVKDVWHVIK